ncbi:MAG: pyrimidine 5'-nucleotidase [Pseudomonadota bacterium]
MHSETRVADPAPKTAPSAADDWSDVEDWIFDLDNTLYPAGCHLFSQIDARMATYIEERLALSHADARKLQKEYYVRYGTTLSGLMHEHAVAPEEFMSFVHDIDVSGVPENPDLARHIADLPGRKFIFTNGSVAHAENVLGKIGLNGLFDDVFDIAAADFTPKPHMDAYQRFLSRTSVKPDAAAMFEDIAHNLEAPHALGMRTVLICAAADWMHDEPAEKRPAHPADDMLAEDHVHHVTEDITAFLGDLIEQRPAIA